MKDIEDYFIYGLAGVAGMITLATFGLNLYNAGQRAALKKIPSQIEIKVKKENYGTDIILGAKGGKKGSPQYIFNQDTNTLEIECDLQPEFKCKWKDDKYNAPVVLEKKLEKQ